jgi:hypothetical protein
VIHFLEAFGPTHLATEGVTEAFHTIQASPPPGSHAPSPLLRNAHMGIALGPGRRNFGDDVTERIYAAYWALRLEKAATARGLVAEALTRHHIPRRRRDAEWTGYDVADRLKQYEATRAPTAPDKRRAHRQWLVEKWRMLYRSAASVEWRE